MQQNMALLYLFDSITKEFSSINDTLKHSLLKTTNKKLDKKNLNLIALTDLIFRALVMHSIKVIVKLNSITY